MSGIIAFLWICLAVFLACAKVTLQGRVSRRYFRNAQDPILFNALMFATIALFLFLFFPSIRPSGHLIFSALAVSCFTFLFQTTYASAMREGPVSLTVLIANFSLFIPICVSMVLYGERLYLTQLIAIVLLVISMLLSVKSDPQNKKPITKKWILLALAAMLSTGVAAAMQKVFGKTQMTVEGADTTFLMLIYLFAAVWALACYAVRWKLFKKPLTASYKIRPRLVIGILAIAAILTVYQKCFMIAMAEIDSTLFFPTQNGMQSLLMTLIGVIFFRDKLSARQFVGVACGIACVVLMNLSLGPVLI